MTGNPATDLDVYTLVADVARRFAAQQHICGRDVDGLIAELSQHLDEVRLQVLGVGPGSPYSPAFDCGSGALRAGGSLRADGESGHWRLTLGLVDRAVLRNATIRVRLTGGGYVVDWTETGIEAS